MDHDIYLLIGRAIHWLTFPILKHYLYNSRRAYLLIIHKRQVLLLKNWYGDGKWALPGGGLKRTEDYRQGLKREVMEELGILIDSDKLIDLNFSSDLSPDFRYFLLEPETQLDVFNVRTTEITSFSWVEMAQLDANNTAVDVAAVITMAQGLYDDHRSR